MKPYLDFIGIQEGKTLKYGPLAFDLPDGNDDNDDDTSTALVVSPQESQRLRDQAVANLTNIGGQERERRQVVGTFLLKATVVYAVGASLLDQGDLNGQFLRLGVWLPLVLGYGFRLSSELGL